MQLTEQFNRAANRYDVLTRLNPGYHDALRDAARALVRRIRADRPTGPLVLWDLGCGSGLSTRAVVQAAMSSETSADEGLVRLVGLDASEGMLAQARAKTWPAGVSFVHSFAQDLPEVAANEQMGAADGVFSAYLMRNVPAEQRDEVLGAIRDQLRPGGWVALQDYHVKGNPAGRKIWTMVCWAIVTPLASMLRGNPSIYRYLWRSVLDNDSTAELADRLERAGFTDLTWSTTSGWQRGILHTVVARRPVDDSAASPEEGDTQRKGDR